MTAVFQSSSPAAPVWHLSQELAAIWPADDPWPIPGWLDQGIARVVKKGPQRTVLRVDLPNASLFIKQHHLPDRLTWVRQSLRGPKGRREFDRLEELARRGVPAPKPLGWAAVPGWLGVGESCVITAAIDGVLPLHRAMSEEAWSPVERRNLAEALGVFLARLHDAGVDHRDLHAGNVLVRRRPSLDLHLVDLDTVRLGSPLTRAAGLANLALFGSGFLLAASRTDRFRFLRSYVRGRGWPIDRAELLAIARTLESEAWTYSLGLWAGRDRRCLESNRYYRKVRNRSHVGMALRTVDDAWLERLAGDPDAALREPGVRILKHSKTSTVAEIVAWVDGQPRPAILKKIGATKTTDPWAALVRPTPILRSWVWGHGFVERQLPTPRPLVLLHRVKNGLWHEGYLVTEKLDHVQELDAYVAGLGSLGEAERRDRLRPTIDAVARAVRELHRRHLSHRDLKAANILITSLAAEGTPEGAARPIHQTPFPVANTNLWFIDLVGVTGHARLGKRRRVQNVARLAISFLSSNVVSRTDRLRFLRIYLAWGLHGKNQWKLWWRAIAAMAAAKVTRNRKAGRAVG